ncbi:hypothetical protein I0C86_13280 [Plantactinospora sp. S1510]|uniref:Prenyltransferase n=1 Tax=Plantactinospora alkalitolerans TaxID=2789879 RepID=A0ABS0GVK9_9ACTN|nr:hypothetical protein [Plantactinospora alkalitolerans]MBF9129927.1 hypothetical protein [Plantactinospora alkalitolerans]
MIRYLLRRFPPHTVGLATVLTFASLQSLYLRAVPSPELDLLAVAATTATFVLLFVQLRLVDDIDDFHRDAATDRSPAAGRRSHLQAGLVATIGLTVLLTMRHWPALLTALAATAAMLLAPRVVNHPRLPGHRILLPIVYEGAPLLIMVYAYAGWRTYADSAASPVLVFGVTGLYWTAYEFWKFSRKLDDAGYRPYGLGPRGRLVALAVLLAVAECCVALIYASHSLPPIVVGYAAAVPLGFGAWIAAWIGTARSGSRPGSRPRPAWAGLSFAFVLQVGLLATAGA